MKRSISQWQTAGFLFTAVLGTFLHFLFELSGNGIAAALVSAVNESIWEHMKLIYYPMLLFSLIQYRFWGREVASFWWVKLAGIMLGLVLIPVIYYVYTGIFGVSVDWFNITIFFLAAGAAFWLESVLLRKDWQCRIPSWAAFALICGISLLFTLMTFFPPQIPFFQDPITGSYGFQG